MEGKKEDTEGEVFHPDIILKFVIFYIILKLNYAKVYWKELGKVEGGGGGGDHHRPAKH